MKTFVSFLSILALNAAVQGHLFAQTPSQPLFPQVELPDSAYIGAEMVRQKQSANAVLEQVNPKSVEAFKATLPRAVEFANRLKRGEAITASAEGAKVIGQIRVLLGTGQNDKTAALKFIQAQANQGNPEALNFLGIAHEMGLLGLKKNIRLAMNQYIKAADQKYVPSIYNLALIEAYGRNGEPEPARALAMLIHASEIAEDSSGRVCGMASFLAYRLQRHTQSQSLARSCASPLAGLAKASDNNEPIHQRLKLLRDVVSTGIDDAYKEMIHITKASAATDPSQNHCKYKLVYQHRNDRNFLNLRQSAQECVNAVSFSSGNDIKQVNFLRSQAADAIAGFVPGEVLALAQMRQNNKAHHSWPVPFLPFSQDEMDEYADFVAKEKTSEKR